jgi:lipopolysaccharide biosynthesis glycosyltransferase
MSKKLIYTICNNSFNELFPIFFKTIREHNPEVDLLVITDKIEFFKNKFEDLMLYQISDLDWKYSGRFMIHNWERIHNYETILYLDCDIICQKNLGEVFNLISAQKNKLSLVQSYLSIALHLDWFLMKGYKASENAVSYNSGTFGFNINQLKIIKELCEFVALNAENNLCDQPIFNAFIDKQNLGDPNLTNYVWLDANTKRNIFNIDDYPLIHFLSGFGEYLGKKQRMEKYLNRNKSIINRIKFALVSHYKRRRYKS